MGERETRLPVERKGKHGLRGIPPPDAWCIVVDQVKLVARGKRWESACFIIPNAGVAQLKGTKVTAHELGTLKRAWGVVLGFERGVLAEFPNTAAQPEVSRIF